MPAPADLAEYRLLRALRAGQPGAFPSLWNAQAGAVWSVVRALCDSDQSAIGWATTFRVELSERDFALDEPIAVQVGAALYAHLHGDFDRDAALPTGRLSADEAGLRQVPEHKRLLYLVDLFFDVGPALSVVAGREAPRELEAVRRLFEPGDDTAARDAVHAQLLRPAPLDVLVVPPGDEPVAKSFRWWPWYLGGALALAVSGLLFWGRLGGGTWEELGSLHAQALVSPPRLQGEPVDLGRQLLADGVPAVLAEAPDLSSLGLTLLGARVDDGLHPVVALLYFGPDGTWTLQHHLHGPPPPDGEPLARVGDVAVHAAGGTPAAAWVEAGATWALLADAPPARVAEMASRILELRRAAAIPPAGSPPRAPAGPSMD